MNKLILSATLLTSFSLLMGSCLSQPTVKENEYLIEGSLSNVPDGAIINLARLNGQVFENVATDTLRNGKFSFQDTISVPSRNMMILSNSEGFPSTWLSFWVGSGKVTKITGKDKSLRMWTVACDLPEQEAENRFIDATREDWQVLGDLMIQETILSEKRTDNTLNISMEEYRAQKDSLQRLSDTLNLSIVRKEIEVMRKEPITPAWIDRMHRLALGVRYDANFKYKEEANDFFARMSDAEKQTPAGREISGLLEVVKKVGVGDDMADGNLIDLEGKEHRLADLKGKYILLDFWSSGCGPCRQAVPEMKEIANSYADKLHVVSISSDSEPIWRKASTELELDGLNWNEFKGQGGLAASYQVRTIPHYVLISPQGKIIDVWEGYGKGTLIKKVKEYSY